MPLAKGLHEGLEARSSGNAVTNAPDCALDRFANVSIVRQGQRIVAFQAQAWAGGCDDAFASCYFDGAIPLNDSRNAASSRGSFFFHMPSLMSDAAPCATTHANASTSGSTGLPGLS